MRVIITLALLCFAAVSSADAPIPELATWESRMLSYGAARCAQITALDPDGDEALTQVYYDSMRVFFQISEYTGDTATWLPCAAVAREIYYDWAITENSGGTSGYWTFSTGLRKDFEVNGTAGSKSGVKALNDNAVFCRTGTPVSFVTNPWWARDAAYCIVVYIDNELLGEARNTRLTTAGADNDFVDKALGYLDQWFVAKTYRAPAEILDYTPAAYNKYYYQPFMVGLVTNALIKFWDLTGDARIQSAITTALDVMWTDAWVSADEGFWYENWKDVPGDAWPAQVGAPDLNLLLANSYAWVYQRTSDTAWRDRADAIFAGGVRHAYLGNGKQFNQSYAYSFDYVNIRQNFDPPIDPPQSTTVVISPLDTTVNAVYGAAGLPYEADCTVTLKDSGGTPITTATTTEGLAKRSATFTGRTAATAYKIAVDCDGTVADVTDTDFTTKPTPAGGNRTVPIQAGDPKVISGVARATVRYDDNAALSTPATVQNTSCSTGCTINLTLAAGLWYYRWEWQNASDTVLAVGSVQSLQVQ